MTTVTISVEELTKALNDSVVKSLGWVVLKPIKEQEDESSPPSFEEELPSVMSEFAFVPSSNYMLEYKSVRLATFQYLLERDSNYEYGELTVFHDMPISSPNEDESTPPPITEPFIPPNIITDQRVIVATAPLGVTFSFMHDPKTNGSTAKFGLGFKITDASPPVYPKLIAAYSVAFDIEKDVK